MCATCCTEHCCNRIHSNVVIVWPELANVGPAMLGICCAEMLRSFGRGLKVVKRVYEDLSFYIH